jgi:monoterpene epsilon-lactone hydrolase
MSLSLKQHEPLAKTEAFHYGDLCLIKTTKMKKTNLLLTTILLGSVLVTGCSKKISVTREQASTMSPQSVDTLKSFKVFRLPVINPSDNMLIKSRKQFALHEAGELKDMKARFNPIIEDTLISGVKVKVITPRNIKPENRNKIAIYIHGGGFIVGSATDRMGMLMTNEMGIKTYSIDYQLAPEAKFPVAMNECVLVYRYLVTRHNPQNITGWSISAGGTHMLAMLVKAKQEGLPMINSIALLSPATDISGNGDSAFSNDGRDLLGYKNQADKLYAAPFAGKASLTDPLVSPIYAQYTPDFPATVLATSTRDLFLSNSARLYWKLKDAGVPAELNVAEGMWHAFQNYPDLPEAVQNRNAVQEFLMQHLHAADRPHTGNTGINSDATKNVSIVRQFLEEVVNGGKFDLVDQLWTPDMIWHGGSMGTIYGLAEYKKILTGNVSGAFTNMHLRIGDVIASGDKVAVYFTNSGKNVGAFMGYKATGNSASWDGMGIYRLQNGKIAEAWFAEDLLQMFNQLGVIKIAQ